VPASNNEVLRRWAELERCMPMLRKYVGRRIKDSDALNDVLQEVSLKILTAEAPDPGSSFPAWSRTVARNVAERESRRDRRRGRELAEPGALAQVRDPTHDPERRTHYQRALSRTLDGLETSALDLLIRRYVLEESPKELARSLSQSPAAMRMRLMRMRTLLRRNKVINSDGQCRVFAKAATDYGIKTKQ
jgi:RNA polymerase sigma factor (sigma-70 family)